MNLENELNKITCRFVECERETRTRQRGADTSSAPLFSSPPVAVGGGCPASPCPCAPPPSGGGREGETKKAPALYHGQRTAKRLTVESGTPLPHHSSTSVRSCQAPFWGLTHHLPQTGCPGKGGLWPLVLTLAWTAWMWHLFLRGAAADPRRAQPAPAAPRREEARRPMALAGPPDRGRQEGEPARRGWGAGTNGATKGEHPRSEPAAARRAGRTTPEPGAAADGEASPPEAGPAHAAAWAAGGEAAPRRRAQAARR